MHQLDSHTWTPCMQQISPRKGSRAGIVISSFPWQTEAKFQMETGSSINIGIKRSHGRFIQSKVTPGS